MQASDFTSKEDLPEVEREKTVGIKARTIIWYLAFSGFAINFVITSNVPFAIIYMVEQSVKNHSLSSISVSSECFGEGNFTLPSEASSEKSLAEIQLAKSYVSIERRILTFFNIEYDEDGFKWDEHRQAQVLGSFFWIHWVTQIPGGVLAAKYGTKFVFGFSQFIASLISLVMPFFCYLDYRWMVALRVMQGFILGLTWPAMHNLIGQWIPPNERSNFVSAYFGSSVGIAIALPIFGFIVKLTSWELIFHICGISGVIWYMLWLYFVYDSPEEHPRIHPEEKKYILQALGSTVTQNNEKKADVPWKAILTSKVVLINVIGHWGSAFGFLTLATQTPSYFSSVFGWGDETLGSVSGLPHLLLVTFSISFSSFADYLLSSGRMSRNNVRRLASFICMILNGFWILGVAYSGCNYVSAVVFLSLALCCNGAVATSVMASVVDIAPNYAGITMGITSTAATVGGFISPIVVGYITSEYPTVEAWQHVFQICAAMLIGCGGIYICFNDTAVQEWNNIPEKRYQEIKPFYTNGDNEHSQNDETKNVD